MKSVTKAAAVLSFGDLEAAEAIYLCRLHDAIGAAIDAGRITNNRGIELFVAARRRLMQESHRAKQASKPQQMVALRKQRNSRKEKRKRRGCANDDAPPIGCYALHFSSHR